MAKKKTADTIPAARGASKAKNAAKAALLLKLHAALESLETDELEWLLSQAEILEANRTAEAAMARLKRSMADISRGSAEPERFDIKLEVSKASRSVNFIINDSHKIFDEKEFNVIASICRQDLDVGERASRLYRWLKAERKDVLIDVGITSSESRTLARLVLFVEGKFKGK